MQTLTLKIEDSYYQKVVDFLELLPKKAVKIETQRMSKAQKQVARDLELYKKGELKNI
jgi:Mg/Co/Ni transporter MgtE